MPALIQGIKAFHHLNPSKTVWIGLLLLFSIMTLQNLVAFSENPYSMDENAIYHFHQAQEWMATHHYTEAIAEYQIAIGLTASKTFKAALNHDIGKAYEASGQAKTSFPYYEKAIALNPDFSLYYEHLVKAYGKTKQLAQQIKRWRQYQAGHPKNLRTWYLLGLLYQQSGQKPAAQNAFSKYLSEAPYSPLAEAAKLYLTGKTVAKQDRYNVQ